MSVKPVLFDVSLRDGIQGADPERYPTSRKKDILTEIMTRYSPAKMEIGSFVPPKVLPIMSDTAEIFDFAKLKGTNADLYALVPNKKGLLDAIHHGITNFSFITSISNEFQIKNARRNLDYKKTELSEMMRMLSSTNRQFKTKLYVSCVNECPISGLIDCDFIIYEILSSYWLSEFDDDASFDEFCLSDTMGTLLARDFEFIVDGLLRFGMAKSRISVHLHVDENNEAEAKRILFACFRRGIMKFDVSCTSDGGCSVSMDRSKLKPNMTYEFLHDTLEDFNSQ
jgi:hydroxymethylglutaryl-CoA lyase